MSKEIDFTEISRHETPEESPGFLLWQVSSRWRGLIEKGLGTIDLTHPQFVLLACLAWLSRKGEKVSQVELARLCKTDVTMTSQILRTLEKKELIKRERLPGNERSKLPKVTEKGIELVKQAIPLVEKIDREFFGKLGQEVPRFTKLLQKLTGE